MVQSLFVIGVVMLFIASKRKEGVVSDDVIFTNSSVPAMLQGIETFNNQDHPLVAVTHEPIKLIPVIQVTTVIPSSNHWTLGATRLAKFTVKSGQVSISKERTVPTRLTPCRKLSEIDATSVFRSRV
jgi:hypothetical protein